MFEFNLFEAYLLDFSYSGIMNIETRFFINLPIISKSDQNLMEVVSICFEMNSSYKPEQGKVKYIFNSEEFWASHHPNHVQTNLLDGDTPNLYTRVQLEDSLDIFNEFDTNFIHILKKYKEDYISFAKEIIARYYHDEDEQTEQLRNQHKRIERFVADIQNDLTLMRKHHLDEENNLWLGSKEAPYVQISTPSTGFPYNSNASHEIEEDIKEVFRVWAKWELSKELKQTLSSNLPKNNKAKSKL